MKHVFADRMALLGTETAFEVLAKAKKLEAQGKDIVHLPGYQNHVYKSATSGKLEPAPKKLPACSSEGCDKSDGCS